MRNLKRVLSLALACVMVIGMMVMTTGAADLGDYDEITNVEAVDVMVALGVLEGDDLGNFNPDGILTREQAAKIICFMLMGKDKAEKLVGTSNFTDVAADRWSAPFISYCASLDIISGFAGNFNPTGELTGVAFGKMLLVALGYDAKVEGYVNNENWATNIGTDVIEAGIDFRGLDLAVPLTRDNAAQMAFNTLSADMVKYTNKGTTITIEGVEVVVGASSAEAVTVTEGDAQAIDNENSTTNDVLQFGEKYFKNLSKGAGTDDDFDRPASHDWRLNGTAFIDVLDAPKVTFTAKTNPAAVAKALKGYTFNGTKLVDKDTQIGATTTAIGELTFSATTDVIATVISTLTANGTVVEIYAASNKAVNDVVVVSYKLGKIGNITTDAKGNVTYTINATSDTVYANEDYGTDTISVYEGIARNDIVLYADNDANTMRYVYPTTSFTGKMTKYNTTDETMVVNGETYTTGSATNDASGLTLAASFTGTDESVFYMDSYGYIVGVDGISVADAYAVIDSIAYVTGSGVDADGYAEARLVFADGTTKVVKIDSIDGFKPALAGSSVSALVTGGTHYTGDKAAIADVTATNATTAVAANTVTAEKYIGVAKSSGGALAGKFYGVDSDATNNTALVGSIFTYTVNNKGAYVLVDEAAVSATTGTFTKGIPTIGGEVANDNTVYVVKTLVKNNPVWTVYNGYKAMPTTNGTAAYDVAKNAQSAVDFIYVDATANGLASATTSDVAFFFGTDYTVNKENPQNILREFKAILNGELTTVIVKNAATNVASIDVGMFDITLEDGVVSALGTKDAATDYNKLQANGAKAANAGVVTIDSATVNGLTTQTSLTYDADTTVYYVHTVSKTINTGDITAMADNSVLYVKTVGKATATNPADKIAIDTIYILIAD